MTSQPPNSNQLKLPSNDGKEKKPILILEFSLDSESTPQIVVDWNYDKETIEKFSSLQMTAIVHGILRNKRLSRFIPLIERFAEKVIGELHDV